MAAAAETDKEVPSFSPEDMKRVEALSELQKKYTEEYAKYAEEKKALDFKYQAIYAELTKQRADIVTGVVDPAEGAAKKGIDKFWLTAMGNQRRVAQLIEEHDEEALEFLKDVTCEYVEGGNGFKLTFHFAPNPFFENEALTKTVSIPNMLGGGPIGTEPNIEALNGCEINWKAGKDLTVVTTKKTVKKKGKRTTVTKTEPRPSFFRFFESPDMEAEMDEEEEEEEDENVLQKHIALQQQIHADVMIATAFKDKLVPRAIDWFTGEAADEDSDDEDDEDYEDDEDEEDDEEEEEEEEEVKPKKGKGKGKRKDDEEDEEEEEGEDDAAVRAALADSFKKGVKVTGKKDGDKKDGAGGDKPQECKQQ